MGLLAGHVSVLPGISVVLRLEVCWGHCARHF